MSTSDTRVAPKATIRRFLPLYDKNTAARKPAKLGIMFIPLISNTCGKVKKDMTANGI